MDFPKQNPKIGSDLIVYERIFVQNFDRFGKRREPILTIQLGRKFLRSKTKFLSKRHFYL